MSYKRTYDQLGESSGFEASSGEFAELTLAINGNVSQPRQNFTEFMFEKEKAKFMATSNPDKETLKQFDAGQNVFYGTWERYAAMHPITYDEYLIEYVLTMGSWVFEYFEITRNEMHTLVQNEIIFQRDIDNMLTPEKAMGRIIGMKVNRYSSSASLYGQGFESDVTDLQTPGGRITFNRMLNAVYYNIIATLTLTTLMCIQDTAQTYQTPRQNYEKEFSLQQYFLEMQNTTNIFQKNPRAFHRLLSLASARMSLYGKKVASFIVTPELANQIKFANLSFLMDDTGPSTAVADREGKVDESNNYKLKMNISPLIDEMNKSNKSGFLKYETATGALFRFLDDCGDMDAEEYYTDLRTMNVASHEPSNGYDEYRLTEWIARCPDFHQEFTAYRQGKSDRMNPKKGMLNRELLMAAHRKSVMDRLEEETQTYQKGNERRVRVSQRFNPYFEADREFDPFAVDKEKFVSVAVLGEVHEEITPTSDMRLFYDGVFLRLVENLSNSDKLFFELGVQLSEHLGTKMPVNFGFLTGVRTVDPLTGQFFSDNTTSQSTVREPSEDGGFLWPGVSTWTCRKDQNGSLYTAGNAPMSLITPWGLGHISNLMTISKMLQKNEAVPRGGNVKDFFNPYVADIIIKFTDVFTRITQAALSISDKHGALSPFMCPLAHRPVSSGDGDDHLFAKMCNALWSCCVTQYYNNLGVAINGNLQVYDNYLADNKIQKEVISFFGDLERMSEGDMQAFRVVLLAAFANAQEWLSQTTKDVLDYHQITDLLFPFITAIRSFPSDSDNSRPDFDGLLLIFFPAVPRAVVSAFLQSFFGSDTLLYGDMTIGQLKGTLSPHLTLAALTEVTRKFDILVSLLASKPAGSTIQNVLDTSNAISTMIDASSFLCVITQFACNTKNPVLVDNYIGLLIAADQNQVTASTASGTSLRLLPVFPVARERDDATDAMEVVGLGGQPTVVTYEYYVNPSVTETPFTEPNDGFSGSLFNALFMVSPIYPATVQTYGNTNAFSKDEEFEGLNFMPRLCDSKWHFSDMFPLGPSSVSVFTQKLVAKLDGYLFTEEGFHLIESLYPNLPDVALQHIVNPLTGNRACNEVTDFNYRYIQCARKPFLERFAKRFGLLMPFSVGTFDKLGENNIAIPCGVTMMRNQERSIKHAIAFVAEEKLGVISMGNWRNIIGKDTQTEHITTAVKVKYGQLINNRAGYTIFPGVFGGQAIGGNGAHGMIDNPNFSYEPGTVEYENWMVAIQNGRLLGTYCWMPTLTGTRSARIEHLNYLSVDGRWNANNFIHHVHGAPEFSAVQVEPMYEGKDFTNYITQWSYTSRRQDKTIGNRAEFSITDEMQQTLYNTHVQQVTCTKKSGPGKLTEKKIISFHLEGEREENLMERETGQIRTGY